MASLLDGLIFDGVYGSRILSLLLLILLLILLIIPTLHSDLVQCTDLLSMTGYYFFQGDHAMATTHIISLNMENIQKMVFSCLRRYMVLKIIL